MKIHTFAVGLLTAAIAGQVLPGRVWGVDVAGEVNSAITYRQAFDAAKQNGAGKSPVMSENVRTAALDENVKGLLAANQNVIGLVKQAGSEAGCDWGALPADMQGVLDTLNVARTIDHLLTLQSRMDLQDKKPDAAVEDWMASVALARRIGEIKLTVASLVQDAVEMGTIDRIAAELPGLPMATRTKLMAEWMKLPAGADGSQIIMGEYAYAQKAIVQQKGPKDWIDVLEPFYKAIAAASGDAPEQFGKVVDEQMAKFKLNPFAQTIGPSMKLTREPMAALEAKREMLETAMSVVQIGKEEVAKSKDPFGAGPFEYMDVKGGFELKSALNVKGKSVSLHVGK
ncbi:MAG TPA: hypothetical protein VFE58_11595 [Tepidisphaeraceae bacterium]|jgi:hypothetical protein|nr:hypothetical protein [Tepidisphaeraceae bacterium]